MAVKITGADKNSPAQQLGLSGCVLLSVDGNEINDMLDYEFYTQGAKLELALMDSAKLRYVTAEKPEYTPLGCQFESYLIDKKHACKNKCMFCFIDQLPKGLRDTLYFKDDDERLSFLFGNYVTLTNLSPHEVQRIIRMHISPINISVHTTDPALRVRMMKNPRAGEVLSYLDDFAAAGITMNCQIVLCRGVNDGEKLTETVRRLAGMYPAVQSIAAVPAGVTRYRENLPVIEPYDKESAAAVLDALEALGIAYKAQHGVRIVYPGDEWYLLAGRPMPAADFYDDYPQLENGVGMWRRLHDEFMDALAVRRTVLFPRRLDVATGTLAQPLIQSLCDTLHGLYPNVHIRVHAIRNDFFGGNVSVAGLVTGTDLAAQLKGRLLGRTLCIPEVMLREEQDMFLDSMTTKELARRLHVRVRILPQDGGAMLAALLK